MNKQNKKLFISEGAGKVGTLFTLFSITVFSVVFISTTLFIVPEIRKITSENSKANISLKIEHRVAEKSLHFDALQRFTAHISDDVKVQGAVLGNFSINDLTTNQQTWRFMFDNMINNINNIHIYNHSHLLLFTDVFCNY